MTKFGVTVNVDAFRVSEMGKYQQINTIRIKSSEN